MIVKCWRSGDIKEGREVQGAHHHHPRKRLQVSQHYPWDWDKRVHQRQEQEHPYTTLPRPQDNHLTKVSDVMKNCSKLAVLGSFSIWNARYSSDWNGGAVLKPWRANTHSDSPSNPLYMYFFVLLWLIAADALPLSWGTLPGLGVICDVSLGYSCSMMQFIGSLLYSINLFALWGPILVFVSVFGWFFQAE